MLQCSYKSPKNTKKRERKKESTAPVDSVKNFFYD